jgi:hypothetical protein
MSSTVNLSFRADKKIFRLKLMGALATEGKGNQNADAALNLPVITQSHSYKWFSQI